MVVMNTMVRLVKLYGCHRYYGMSSHMVAMDMVVQTCQAIWLPWIWWYTLVKLYGCHGYCGKACQVMVAMDTVVKLVKSCG